MIENEKFNNFLYLISFNLYLKLFNYFNLNWFFVIYLLMFVITQNFQQLIF